MASSRSQAAEPFVGRDLERQAVTAAVTGAAAGHGELLLLSGEAGIGKTRLAREAAVDAASHGWVTV
jgi:MoxR-like ATPase